eukprot:TRINITY_DN5791_c0_g1_i1.p1 TRINITY_DN5791_c0_g1~~TRINITY_DN5791_c0_g1_i1.p1  ORF type:complete len:141 (-),score=37.15 TRINITY_DN5791_c0_g1_i1:17-439(-)
MAAVPKVVVEEKYDKHRQKVTDYLQQHHIHDLIHHLLTLLVYNRPAQPREFLVAELQKLKQFKTATQLLDENELETMFHMIDINNTGYVTGLQVKNTMRNLGLPLTQVVGGLEDKARVNMGDFKAAVGGGFDALAGTAYK